MELKIAQVREADFRLPVPAEHGIDSLGQFCAARLVDATSVDPSIGATLLFCLLACCYYLAVASLACNIEVLVLSSPDEFFKRHLLPSPSVREDGVRRNFIAVE